MNTSTTLFQKIIGQKNQTQSDTISSGADMDQIDKKVDGTSDDFEYEDNEDSGTKIDCCKEQADPVKYFGLFNKYIPRYENDGYGRNIALIDISSIEVEMKIVALNKKAVYWIFDNKYNYDMLVLMCPDTDIKSCCNGKITEDLYNILEDKNMKFDCVIGNPPYSGSLHLKILKKTLDFIDFKNGGEIIWLHPIDKFQACVKHKKPFSIPVTNIFKITQDCMNDIFGICNWVAGCITCIDKTASTDSGRFHNIVPFFNLYLKIKNKNTTLLKTMLKNISDGFGLRFFQGCNCDASHGYTISPTKYETAISQKKTGHILYCKFLSDGERFNCWTSCRTDFIKFCCMLDSWSLIPYMGDCVNPRTGLKGYLSEWTDDDFYQYFGITDDEKKIIEDTMAKYK